MDGDAIFWQNLFAIAALGGGMLVFFWNRYTRLRDEQSDLRERIAKLEERTACPPPKRKENS